MAEFKQWAETWTEDICAWRDMHLYDGLYVYSVDTRRTVEQGALPHEVICR